MSYFSSCVYTLDDVWVVVVNDAHICHDQNILLARAIRGSCASITIDYEV